MKSKVQLDGNMSVADLLDKWPQAAPVFIRRRMACVGCSMAMFETLEDAARIYGVLPRVFINELQAAIETPSGE